MDDDPRKLWRLITFGTVVMVVALWRTWGWHSQSHVDVVIVVAVFIGAFMGELIVHLWRLWHAWREEVRADRVRQFRVENYLRQRRAEDKLLVRLVPLPDDPEAIWIESRTWR